MLAGEQIHLLIVIGIADDNPVVQAFAKLKDAREAWHDALNEAMEMENIISIDELAEYEQGQYFIDARGNNSAEVRTVEVE